MNEITVKRNVTDEDLGDIIAAALEGGIGYWASVAIPTMNEPERAGAHDYWMIVPNGGKIIVIEDEDETRHTLDKEKLMKGIQMVVDAGQWDGDDVCDIDAGVADNIIQYAIFSKLIYG